MVGCTVARRHGKPLDKSSRLGEISELKTDKHFDCAAVSLINGVFSYGNGRKLDGDKSLNVQNMVVLLKVQSYIGL